MIPAFNYLLRNKHIKDINGSLKAELQKLGWYSSTYFPHTEEDTCLADNKIEKSFRPEGSAINDNSLNIWDNLKSARRLSGFTNFSLFRLLYLEISIVQRQEISR